MPGSVPQGKQEIKEFIDLQNDIKTIIDVGAGGCTYPQLLGPKYEFIAIEIWAPYVKQFNYQDYYKQVIVGDVRFVKLPKGDCIIFGDILEHIDKREALQVITEALKEYKHLIISVPLSSDLHKGLIGDELMEIRPGKEHFGNWFELHVSPWYWNDLEKITDWKVKLRAGKNDMGIFIK